MSRIAAIRHHWTAAALAVVCTVGLIGSSGCILAVQSDSHYKRGHDAMESLATIRAGTTSRAWVVEHMGHSRQQLRERRRPRGAALSVGA